VKLSPHRRLLSVAFLAVLLSCSGDSPTETAPTPAQIQAMAGGGQTGVAEMPLAAELVARVTDRRGRPVAGVTVAWTIAPEAGTLSATATPTDSRGEARTRWTLGPAAGTFTVTASAPGLTLAAFTATAAPAPPARVEKVAGDGQGGAPAGRLADSLVVRVASAQGRPVAGATVGWSVAAGGGTLSASTTVTDAAGIARVAWTLGAEGTNTALAGVGSLQPVTFTAASVRVASVTVSQTSGTVGRGDTLRLTATPRDAAGNPLAGRYVQWSSSAPSIAAVSDSGVVTGLAYGAATITAASEGRTASTSLRVTSEDRTAPRLKALSVSPATVDVSAGPAQVSVTLAATDAGSGVQDFYVNFRNAAGTGGVTCGNWLSNGGVRASGTPADGVWKCTATIPRGALAGTWQLQVILRDTVGNEAGHTRQQLRAAGFPDSLVVVNSGPSDVPRITAVSLVPTAVDVSDAAATVEVSISAVAGTGVRYLYANVQLDRGPGYYAQTCQVWVPTGQIVTSGTWKCRLTIPRSSPAGAWKLSTLVIEDQAGTVRFYGGERPETMEFPATIQVTSRTEDLVPPELTGLSLSAGSVDLSTGPKTIDAMVSATDGTGLVRTQVMLRGPNASNACASDLLDGTAKTLAMKCPLTFGVSAPSGTWQVSMVVLYDVVGNSRAYLTPELQAAGFPTTLTVTR
jgi:hypothetical protein